MPTPKAEVPTYYSVKFSWKCLNTKKIGPRGGTPTICLCRSTTGWQRNLYYPIRSIGSVEVVDSRILVKCWIKIVININIRKVLRDCFCVSLCAVCDFNFICEDLLAETYVKFSLCCSSLQWIHHLHMLFTANNVPRDLSLISFHFKF